MRRAYESDLILVERLRRTLRSWRSTKARSRRSRPRRSESTNGPAPVPKGPQYRYAAGRSPVGGDRDRAPLDGVILEKNLTIGDIVTTDDDLFKIADLSRLVVMANVYEEDLPTLSAIPRTGGPGRSA